MTMEPVSRDSEQPQQGEDSGPPLFFNLPELGHQQSLQALIEDALGFQGDEYLNASAVPTQRDETSDSDEVTIGAPAEDASDEGDRCSTTGGRNNDA